VLVVRLRGRRKTLCARVARPAWSGGPSTSPLGVMAPTLRDLQLRSASSVELVLEYADALAALDVLERLGAIVLGWEGWLRHADDRLGHSARYQGTADLSSLSRSQAYDLCRRTIRDAHSEYLATPEVPHAQLLFCVSHDP